MATSQQTTQAANAGGGKSASSSADDATLRDISAQIETLKSDLAHLTEAMGDYGKARYRGARRYVERRAKDARHRAEEGYDHIQSEAEYYGRQAQDYIRTQPGTALGIAAGIGFLVGLFASRK